jgi:chitin disaccharide deacetylase
MRRELIVNADDFGRSPGINRGVAAAHERGIVTSASLMVRWPAARAAAAYAREHPELGVGLHVDLGEWVIRDGAWTSSYVVVALCESSRVETEVERQLGLFRKLVGHDPTHLDSHQHVHDEEPVRSVLERISLRLGVPLRSVSEGVRYCGGLYGQTAHGEPLPDRITPDALVRILRSVRPGVTELGCHPGFGDDAASPYARERELEVATLCDPRVREAVASCGIVLRSFDGIAASSAPAVRPP